MEECSVDRLRKVIELCGSDCIAPVPFDSFRAFTFVYRQSPQTPGLSHSLDTEQNPNMILKTTLESNSKRISRVDPARLPTSRTLAPRPRSTGTTFFPDGCASSDVDDNDTGVIFTAGLLQPDGKVSHNEPTIVMAQR